MAGIQPYLGYWPRSRRRPRRGARPRAGGAGQPGRRGGSRHPVDASGGPAVDHGRRPDPPPRRLQRALCLPPAGRRRLCRPWLRHPLRQQRHRLPPRPLCGGRADGGGRAAPSGGRVRRAAGQQRRRVAHGPQPGDRGRPGPGPGGRLRRAGRPSRRGGVHGTGHRPVGDRRGRSLLGRPRARHVPPRQRLASMARTGPLRPPLAGTLPGGAAGPGRPDRRAGRGRPGGPGLRPPRARPPPLRDRRRGTRPGATRSMPAT